MKINEIPPFEFKPFSRKQLKILTWWQENSPVSDRFMIVADGSIRSGKSVVCISSFLLYIMTHFNYMNAAMAGRTVLSLRRNIVQPLKQIAKTLNMEIIDHRSENYLEVIKGDVSNYLYLFGGKDEASQDLVQGLTLCSCFLDEVALMPESFYNQITARLSVEGAKVWTTSNPSNPQHWFYKNVICKLEDMNGLYVHFTMDDNPSLNEGVKERYKSMYSGVWAKRFIEGRWAVADGLIYDMFDEKYNIIDEEDIPYDDAVEWKIGVDYGTGNATVFELSFSDSHGNVYLVDEYYYAGRLEAQEENNYDLQKTDLEYTEDMREFINSHTSLTGRTYREIPIIVDPAANSFKLQLRRYHMKTKNAKNDVLFGIRIVSTLFKQRKLKISTKCVKLLEEIHTYQWDTKKQMQGRKSMPFLVGIQEK